MEDLPVTKRIIYRAAGYLYASLYYTSDRLLIGASILGWITVILFFLGLYLWLRSGSIAWFLALLFILFAVRVAYWIAQRNGFIVFIAQVDDQAPGDARRIKDYQKFALMASGVFSITGWEEYMFRRPTKLWRLPMGDHALMVQSPAGRYLYQFIEVGYIKRIRPGCLVYGSRVNFAFEIDFRTTWGPVAGETEFNWFAPGEGSKPKRLKRTLHLGFENKANRDAVWQSILRENKE
ncbi:MAG: hypothetical protein WA996_16980 [Candidatus Promineifilaceae bacterium]